MTLVEDGRFYVEKLRRTQKNNLQIRQFITFIHLPTVRFFMEPLVLAKRAAGQYFSDLVEACGDHFKRNYPECINTNHHETVMCPPVFRYGYVAPTGEASGAMKLSKVEEDTIRGYTAELKIFHLLEKFGEKTKQPMFVLTQLKLSEFSKSVLQQMPPADHPVLGKISTEKSTL